MWCEMFEICLVSQSKRKSVNTNYFKLIGFKEAAIPFLNKYGFTDRMIITTECHLL